MAERFQHRSAHYALLVMAWALVCLPNLGGPSLWDIDEGNNANCAREMMACGNLIIPTFNTRLRYDKPALLYWCQIGCYHLFGVNKFAARLPSALAALAGVLAACELGRRAFGKTAGLLAGLILVTSPLYCAAGHFANPDALLTACTTLNLWLFYRDYHTGGRGAPALAGVTGGLAVLAKGPVGLVLPLTVVLTFLLWERKWRYLLNWRLLGAALLFVLVAAPWYVWVGVETKGDWLLQFWTRHNAGRYLETLENHSGPYVYYVPVLLAGLAPWSVFLGLIGWQTWKALRVAVAGTAQEETEANPARERSAARFLVCWFAVYFVFFSLARTKLPNYILPLYPPTAVLAGWWLAHWREGRAEVPGWLMQTGLVLLGVVGLGVSLCLLAVAGWLPVPGLRRVYPGLEEWAWLGGVLPAGAGLAWWCLRRGWRGGMIGSLACSALLFTGVLGCWGGSALDGYKSPRPLVQALPADQLYRESRVGCYQYFQPSLVFYCQREVAILGDEKQLDAFLETPLPSYLFVPARVWQELRERVPVPCREVGRHHDLYDGCEIVVVTNE